MHTTNPNRIAALFLAVLALGVLPVPAQGKPGQPGKSFPDEFQEKWEKVGPNVRVKRHQDGSRTVFQRSVDDRSLTKKRWGINGALRLITVYILDATGNPRSCKIWDGKKNLLYKVSYAYSKTNGRLMGEKMFDARVLRRDPNSMKESPIRVMYYNYDAQGKPTRPEVYTFNKGLNAEDVFGPEGTFPHDNPFNGGR